jgi:hypothetical protein
LRALIFMSAMSCLARVDTRCQHIPRLAAGNLHLMAGLQRGKIGLTHQIAANFTAVASLCFA